MAGHEALCDRWYLGRILCLAADVESLWLGHTKEPSAVTASDGYRWWTDSWLAGAAMVQETGLQY
jgi:hypothetical protein